MVNRVIRGPMIEIDGEKYPVPDMLNEIIDSMEEEVEEIDDNNEDLANMYMDSDETVRKYIDATLICICGYSLPTLMRLADEDAATKLLDALGITPPQEEELNGEEQD